MKIRKCFSCGTYTFKQECPKCHSQTYYPKPPKFSLEDKYGKYRRKLKLVKRDEDRNR
ncbi:MAG: RNA-protein complex protein Nop10 [Methanomicrobia archaeon]|nr:RNA-protein complex protein Nop10 [Methanomicrobia archaeon]RLF95514.1 MAG: RNA-protein complex protein Nop10 [Thermococci archaeon]RLG02051.1 MAG: RNA-protein complex protein Nop10 [Thermococci archaeon]HDN81394.1 RNA-protein complex protein Nop10 [Methanomicrobia archaeon]